MQRILIALNAALMLLAAPLLVQAHAQAQARGVGLDLRYGLAIPSEDYAADCGDPSGALSLDVHGRGRLFPRLAIDHFSGSGMGGDDLCFPLVQSGASYTSGVRLNGATRVGIGGGARLGNRWVLIEGTVSGGVISARPGFTGGGASDDRRLHPHYGGDVNLVLFRYLVLSGGVHWTRLTLEVRPDAGTAKNEQSEWSPMSTVQFGLRIPLGGR